MFKKNIEAVKEKIFNMLKVNYPESEIKKDCIILIHEGKFANASVFRYNDGVLDITIKDFSGSPWFIKQIFGRIFVNIEGHSLLKLEDNPSTTTGIVFLSPYTLSFRYVKGEPLKQFNDNEISKDFFITLEKNINEMHKKDIVHLDLRNLGNIIMSEKGYPYIIDFQSCISTKHLPKKLTEILRKADLTGVYKCWKRKCSEPLDKEREKIFDDFQKIRKIWIFRGYPLQRFIRKLKNRFK